MLSYLSVLSIYLILLHSATSVDFINNKRVLRRQTQDIRTYKSNHPPIIETDDKIPVAVIYNDEEIIKVTNTNGEKSDVAMNGKTTLTKAPPANHPPSHGLQAFPEGDDSKGDLKSRARSLQILASEPGVPKSPEVGSTTARTEIKKRKSVQKVRKVKINKSQIDVQIRESEEAKNKDIQSNMTTTTNRSHGETSLHAPQIFERRKGTRDPVVPIIESENYVFSHSGDFHYSYEGGDGTKAYERGNSNGSSGSAVEGNFSYKDTDGNNVSLTYTADENGYRPVGAHLPTPPPIPPAIARALAYLATKTTPEPITERIKS